MLQKDHRIREDRDYARLYQRGRRLETANLRCFFLPSRLALTRLGFVVSKRSTKKQQAAGKIVDRNRLKRVLRDEARRLLNSVAPGFDIVKQSKSGAVKIKSQELRAELRGLLTKARILS